MRREQSIYKDFDLPVAHLGREGHYAPEKAYDEGEIARRAELPWGTLIAEQQQIGMRIAANTLYVAEEPRSIEFSTRLLAASGLNTAWYCFARDADVMRRRLKLPLVIAGKPEWRPDSAELKRDAIAGYEEADRLAYKVIKGFEYHSPRTVMFNMDLGRTVGKTSLTLAALDVGDIVSGNSLAQDHHVQHLVRERAKSALNDSRTLIDTLGSYPSLAQLANPNSDLSVYWRHNAPEEARKSFEMASEEVLAGVG